MYNPVSLRRELLIVGAAFLVLWLLCELADLTYWLLAMAATGYLCWHLYHLWSRYGVLCVEMETAGIYTMAARHGVQALSILTISDSLLTKERSTPKQRESGFREMVEIALHVGID